MPLVDREFIFGKGRCISLSERFPDIYSPSNAGNIFLIEKNDSILSFLVCRQFVVSCKGRGHSGVMIGGVYTDPAWRGKHLASDLLKYATRTLRERSHKFAVLWTSKHAFYARLGWIVADRGVFGELPDAGVRAVPVEKIKHLPAGDVNVADIEAIRARYSDYLIERTRADYHRLPPPVESAEVFVWSTGDDRAAYALVGSVGSTGVLYEMIGNPEGFSPLWQEVCRKFRRILVNDVHDSASHRWLLHNTRLVWQPKPLAMWLPLSPEFDLAAASSLYIPYFDRI